MNKTTRNILITSVLILAIAAFSAEKSYSRLKKSKELYIEGLTDIGGLRTARGELVKKGLIYYSSYFF
jgi:hypothetical protein